MFRLVACNHGDATRERCSQYQSAARQRRWRKAHIGRLQQIVPMIASTGNDHAIAEIQVADQLVCLPTMPSEAGPLAPDDAVSRPDTAPYTRPFSLVGAPAISLPCGLGDNGLPLGVQFVARYGDDVRLLAFAHALETSDHWPWQTLEPDLATCM